MKRAISGILCMVILLLGAVSAQAAALDKAIIEQPVLYSAYTNTTYTHLGISGGQATCEGSIIGYSGTTTKVKIELYLERKTASASTWSPYASGSKTFDSYTGAYQLKVSVTSGYQYRVRGVYTAWSGSKSESLTSYSGVVAY